MANYRQIHVSIWKDEWFLELEPQEKLLFIYLFSNESTSLSGLYKIALRVICFETGLDKDIVLATLGKFAQAGKAYYEDGIIWITNMRKYHETTSELVQKRIQLDINKIPECNLKRAYIDGMDSLLIGYPYPKHKDVLNLNENVKNAPKNGAQSGEGLKPPKHPERQELINYFLAKTGLPRPRDNDIKVMQKLWWTPMDDILNFSGKDIATAKDVIDKSIFKLKERGMTISDPNSIIKTARSVYADRNQPGPNSVASETY